MSPVPQVYVSSGAFAGVTTVEELLPRCREAGIEAVELSSGLRSGGDFDEAVAGAGDSLRFLLHNYVPAPPQAFVLNLADSNETNRQRSLEFCGDSLRRCARHGIPFYSVHAGFVTSLSAEDLGRPERQVARVDERGRALAMERFLDAVGQLDGEAQSLGVRLLLENNVHARTGAVSHLLLVTGGEIQEFFERHRFSSVGLLLDLGHLAVSSRYLEFDALEAVERVAPWIEAVHLSDNDGWRDSNEKVRETSWFWEPLNRNCRPDLVAVAEVYRLSLDDIAAQRDLIVRKLS